MKKMDENRFELNGKIYIARDGTSCHLFDFYNKDCDGIPPCSGIDRKDQCDVVFVEKDEENEN